MTKIKQDGSAIQKASEDKKHRQPNNWTIMIYHSGDSDLGEEFIWAMKEMLRVGTPERVEVIALMDSISPDLWQFSIPPGTALGTQDATSDGAEEAPDGAEEAPDGAEEAPDGAEEALELRKGISVFDRKPSGHPIKDSGNNIRAKAWAEIVLPEDFMRKSRTKKKGVKATEVKKHGGTDMASGALLKGFVAKCVKEHRAEHYMLILSGHGDGAIGNTFLLDRGAESYMTLSTLNTTLNEIIAKPLRQKRIDILGLDACVMMTAEVAHLLSKNVQNLVASQGFMTMTGWPYHTILEYLIEEPRATAEKLASEIVTRCIRYYTDYARVGLSVDLAACRLNEKGWSGVAGAIKSLSKELSRSVSDLVEDEPPESSKSTGTNGGRKRKARLVTNALIAAHWFAQSYASEKYVDLHDFCEQLMAAAPELTKVCAGVIDSLEPLVMGSCYAGSGFQHSHGVSLYFPWVATEEELGTYNFEREVNGSFKRGSDGPERSLSSTPFHKETNWGTFLESFIIATRRDARYQENGEIINMPPEGYRDHARDLAHRNNVPSNTRNNVPSNTRGNPILAKVKNPALFCYVDTRVDDISPNAKSRAALDYAQTKQRRKI